jgi:hypothetical protein
LNINQKQSQNGSPWRLKDIVVMMEEPTEMAESAKGLEKENGPCNRTQAVAHVLEKTE